MRLTMMGNQEKLDVSKMSAYAPVASRFTYLVIIATLINRPNIRFKTLDVIQAFLSSKMKRVVYVNHPPGFVLYVDRKGRINYRLRQPGEKPRSVMKLMLALYGGMECGRLFFQAWITFHVKTLGFRQVQMDQCVLIKESGDNIIVLAFHVDDSQVANEGEAFWEDYCIGLKSRFGITQGDLTGMLGMRILVDYELRIVRIDQEMQIRKMLSLFGMDGANMITAENPASSDPQPSKADIPTDPEEQERITAQFDLRAAVGHLNFLQCGSHPEISAPLKVGSRFMQAYGRKHVAWVRHIMRYLAGTAAQPLILRSGYTLGVQIFTDASHACDPDTRRSIIGVVIKVCGNTVLWTCLYSKIVSHSSCESELMALDKGATMGMFVRWLTELMTGPLQGPVEVFVDNQSTIDITTNPVNKNRNLHIHARYFYVRDLVQAGFYNIWHLESKHQLADIIVSFKGTENFKHLLPLLMQCARVEKLSDNKYHWDRSLLLL
jgi:hypothetical protein